MRFSVQQADMAGALAKVVSLAKGKTTVQALSMVRIEAAGDHLAVRATNLEIDIQAKCAATIERAGVACVNAAQFAGIISSLPKAAVTVYLDMGVAHITSGRSAFKLVSMHEADFPAHPSGPKPTDAVAPGDVRWLLDGVSHAVSDADMRPNLCGVFVRSSGKTLTFVASDGHRLSLRERAWVGPEFEGIVPVPALESIADMKDVLLAMDNSRLVAASTGGDTLTALLIDGRFPDYQAVMPKSHKASLVVGRDGLKEAVKRVSLMALDRARTMRFRHEDGEWVIEAVTPQAGEARERIDVDATGDIVELGMNGSYLLEALAATDDDRVMIQLGDSYSPIEVGPMIQDGDDVTRHVIMPIRV